MNARLQRVVEEVFPGATLRSQRKLLGGVSAKVHELEIALPGREIRRVVLRVRGGPGWTGQSAISLEKEFMLQEALHRAGFPVPAPHHVDSSCQLLPEHFMLMERLEGSVHVATDREDAATRMADVLLRLHELNRDSPGLPQLPNREIRGGSLQTPDEGEGGGAGDSVAGAR